MVVVVVIAVVVVVVTATVVVVAVEVVVVVVVTVVVVMAAVVVVVAAGTSGTGQECCADPSCVQSSSIRWKRHPDSNAPTCWARRRRRRAQFFWCVPVFQTGRERRSAGWAGG
jgi:hypothetical protein